MKHAGSKLGIIISELLQDELNKATTIINELKVNHLL